ncbi:hypothetical protein D3C86_2263840 [compost metagenome]
MQQRRPWCVVAILESVNHARTRKHTEQSEQRGFVQACAFSQLTQLQAQLILGKAFEDR